MQPELFLQADTASLNLVGHTEMSEKTKLRLQRLEEKTKKQIHGKNHKDNGHCASPLPGICNFELQGVFALEHLHDRRTMPEEMRPVSLQRPSSSLSAVSHDIPKCGDLGMVWLHVRFL